jgi:hypothetical protein
MDRVRDVRSHLLMWSILRSISFEVDILGMVEMACHGLDASLALPWRHSCLDSSYLCSDIIVIVRVIGCMLREGFLGW